MKLIWDWIKNNPNRAMFLVPILLVAGISISHVVSWYDIANPISWAIYLSIAIEIAAMTALVAATNKIKGGVWFMFGIVTFIQMIGNIFFSYKEIDANGDLFKSWVELTSPIWESLGSDTSDIPAMKRWLAFLEGGLLPIISLTSLHFFVKYKNNEEISKETEIDNEIKTPEKIVLNEEIFENVLETPEVLIKTDIVEPVIETPNQTEEENITTTTTTEFISEPELIKEEIVVEETPIIDVVTNEEPIVTEQTEIIDNPKRLTYTKPD